MNIKLDKFNCDGYMAGKAEAAARAQVLADELWDGKHEMTGWVEHPNQITDAKLDEFIRIAADIRANCDTCLMVGTGGSYIGAKAVTDILAQQGVAGSDSKDRTEVEFVGNSFSARHMKEVMSRIDGKDVSMCVISKSGGTAEVAVAYGVFKDYLVKKYGEEEANKRIFVITEDKHSFLYDEMEKFGYGFAELPKDIGGRYSVLSSCGLIPLAIAGVDIKSLVNGAKSIAKREAFDDEALEYAVMRYLLYSDEERGKKVEFVGFFEPFLGFLGEWFKQLFAESEGKDGKGLLPVPTMLSRDLHSIGQYLQEGPAFFFETFLSAREDDAANDIVVPEIEGLSYGGKSIEGIKDCSVRGTMEAHIGAGTPVMSITVPSWDAASLGELLYFFEVQCAVSALLIGVNPFNQPGVEAYKKNMRKYIDEMKLVGDK